MILHRSEHQVSLRFDDGHIVILLRHEDHYHMLADVGKHPADVVDTILSVLENGPDPTDVDLLTMIGIKLN